MTIHSEGINPTANVKLIDENTRIVLEYVAGRRSGMCTQTEIRDAARQVLDALAVFEKAHTPTDDEREALTYLITAFRFRERGLRGTAMEPDLAVSRPLAEFLLAEGFRRTEIPEPSADWDRVHDRPADIYTPPEDRIVRPEPQGEPSDAHLSNVSINGVRQTWQQLYEREHEAHLTLQGYRTMLSDLDRNASGRHEGDYDTKATGNGGISAGNPHLTTGQIIGYDIGGREYVVPEPRDRGTLSAWVRAAGGVR